ncbi:MAG TPA: esterase-like activity of phytase family protein [Edaphocola sp.]|nr:esterase-like activity of phytase family protein [Edaphocola sp.]
MKKITTKIFIFLAALSGPQARAQVQLLNNYQTAQTDTIGTYQDILFREGGFSTLFPIAHTNGTEFYTCSDRGVNIDAANANPAGCHPTYDKIFPFPGYAPKIHRIRINGNAVDILESMTIKRPDGSNASGLINPTGFGSTATEEASTDTVEDCNNFSQKVAAKDIWGIDPEGLVVDRNGDFWLSEENGPTIWQLNASGKVLKRYTPYASQPGAANIDQLIDTVWKYRRNNRGLESLAITPNGKLYALIQSPLLYPDEQTGTHTQVHRLLELDPVSGTTRMFVYLNDGEVGSGSDKIRLKDWKTSDMAAVNDSMFLVIEAGKRGQTDIKKIYLININNATPITSELYNGKTVEALADSAHLAEEGIIPVSKKLFLDLKAHGWPAELGKAEGLAIINDSTIAVANDNDFGQISPNENGIAMATGESSHVLIFRLQGDNKIPDYVPLPANPPSGIETVTQEDIRVFPNPARQYFNIQFRVSEKTNVHIELINALGRKVLPVIQQQLNSGIRNIRITTQGLAAGVYFLNIGGDHDQKHVKVIIRP